MRVRAGASQAKRAVLTVLAALLPLCSFADPALLALVVDDLGNDRGAGERTAALQGSVTCSILPHTPFAVQVASLCREQGKEVFIHLPMEPASATADPGPGALVIGDSRERFRTLLREGLASVPGAVGVNNHMGSLLTRHVTYMDWLMSELAQYPDLVFVDSATTVHSQALRLAAARHIRSARRDVFLDDDPSPDAIRASWQRLLGAAEQHGSAIGIGHPREETLSILELVIPDLERRGIMLVGVEAIVSAREKTGVKPWQESLSRLQPVSRK